MEDDLNKNDGKTVIISENERNFLNPLQSFEKTEVAGDKTLNVNGKKIIPKNIIGTTILPEFRESSDGVVSVLHKAERFESKKIIGIGGGGEVELVLDKDIYRLVAVKRLKREFHNPTMLMRFVDEIRTVGHLEHPNIVPIHDVGKDKNGQYYFIMKYVYGETIREIIEKLRQGNKEYHNKYSFQYRTEIFREILKAIDFAHDNGIIHRDIKPANIMVGPHGEVVVMDWGISKRIKGKDMKIPKNSALDKFEKEIKEMHEKLTESEKINMTESGMIIGTPAFMSPEQVMKKDADERSDIYSLCALFYEFLTLKSYLPRKKSMDEILTAVVNEKPKFAMMAKNRFQSAVPADLSHIISKGLKKNPAERYGSVKEMLHLFNLINEGLTPVQCPFTLTKRSYQWLINIVADHPMFGVIFFIILLLLAGSGLFFSLSFFL